MGMMKSGVEKNRLVPVFLLTWLLAAPLFAAQPRDYAFVVLKGELTDPEKNQPMPLASICIWDVEIFESYDEDCEFETFTDADGKFVFEKLPLSEFRLKITTNDGENIRALNSLGLDENSARLILKISDRVSSETTMDIGGDRFAVVTDLQKKNWKKFWKETLYFIGGAGLLALGL